MGPHTGKADCKSRRMFDFKGGQCSYPLTVQGSDGNDYQRTIISDLPGGSDGKASVYNVGDPGSIPGLGRSPGEGNGNPLQHSCLENPMDRGA